VNDNHDNRLYCVGLKVFFISLRCQEDYNTTSPLENCRRPSERRRRLLCGWRPSSRTWNPITSPWMKQMTWLRIVHSGDWCLRLALLYALL